MVSGGILQQEATKLGLGKVEATAKTLSGPAPVIDALLSGSADYGTAALPSLLILWDKTHGTPNEIKAVGTVSNGAMVLYTINPNVKTIADFTEKDRIAVPSVRISFNAMMLEMAAEKIWNDPHRLDHLTVGLGHPDAVAALSAGYGSATITAHIAVQPFTARGLKLPGAHVVADSREVFGGPLTQITLLATKKTKERIRRCSKPSPMLSINRSKSPMRTNVPPRFYGRTLRKHLKASTTWWLSSAIPVSNSPHSPIVSLSSPHFSIALAA